MRPINFPEVTKFLQKPEEMTDEECGSLPVWNDGLICISCWRANWRERLSILFFGKVWVRVCFGQTQPPISLEGKKTIFCFSPKIEKDIANIKKLGEELEKRYKGMEK